jgi:hypothetical protein
LWIEHLQSRERNAVIKVEDHGKQLDLLGLQSNLCRVFLVTAKSFSPYHGNVFQETMHKLSPNLPLEDIKKEKNCHFPLISCNESFSVMDSPTTLCHTYAASGKPDYMYR